MKVQEQLDRLNKNLIESVKGTNDKMDKEIEAVNIPQSIQFVKMCEAGMIDPITASEHIEMFTVWIEGLYCSNNMIVQYNGKLYQVIEGQAHTAQTGWEPDVAVSLFNEIADPTLEYPPYSQPIGSHDAYDEGDKITYNEQHYISNINNNVWSPSANPDAWKLVTDDSNEPTGTLEDPIPFTTGMEVYSGKYYTYNDVLYLCIRDSGTALYHEPSALLGNYFELVE